MGATGNRVDFSFDAGTLPADEVERLTAEMWADLPFDRDALAALKRDGLPLDGLHLGGQSPYRFAPVGAGKLAVETSGPDAETLLDLWRVHFLRGIRPRTLAA